MSHNEGSPDRYVHDEGGGGGGGNVTVDNFPSDFPDAAAIAHLASILAALLAGIGVTQLTSPWVVSGTVAVSNFPASVEVSNDVGNPVPVSATDLDTRDLTFAQDSVDASGSQVIAVGPDALGTPPTENPVFIAGWDGVNVRSFSVDVNGVQYVQGYAADGSPVAGNPVRIGGKDGSGNTQDIATDTSGNIVESNSAAIAASASVLDDWDESDRAKVNPIVGQAGIQAGAGTVSANTTRVAIATDANAVDTELPAAAALADNTANPTVPGVGAFGMVYDPAGGNWDRWRSYYAGDSSVAGAQGFVPLAFAPGGVWGGLTLNGDDELLVAQGLTPFSVDPASDSAFQGLNGVIYDNNGTASTVKVAHLDMTTATTTDIVAAVSGKRIRVLEYHIEFVEITGTVVNFARGAGTTRCTGSPTHSAAAAAGSLKSNVTRAAPTGSWLLETGDGEALRVTNSAAADISVAIVYIEVL